MTSDTYRQSLQKAQADLMNAVHERDKWTMEIARLEQLVRSLTAVFASTLAVESAQIVGIQELVLSCVRSSEIARSAIDVRTKLESLGYDLTKYANPLAIIHGALKRLEATGHIYESTRGHYLARM